MERHRTDRAGWLRAAVSGANDGILSMVSLVPGVAAAHAAHGAVMGWGSPAWHAGDEFRSALARAATAGVGAPLGTATT
jgi:hypothetical protein